MATPTAAPVASLAGPVCAPDLAVRPPLTAQAAGSNEQQLQTATLIASAQHALGAVTQYSITATIDLAHARVRGRQVVQFVNNSTADLTSIYFGLYPNAPYNEARLDVTEVVVDNQQAEVSLQEQDTALRVALRRPLAPRATATVHMDFVTTVPTRVVEGYAPIAYIDGIMALASWYPIALVPGPNGWHTALGAEWGDFVFSAVSLYRVDLTSPQNLVVVASGLPFDIRQNADGSKTQTFRAGPVRDFYITASTQYCTTSTQVGATTINSYYLAGHGEQGKAALKVAADAFALMNRQVGVYPYREFDVAESPVRAGGVEYPGVVAISSRYYGAGAPGSAFEFVVAHEAAHQWWYALVGNDQITEPWLDEALAEYSTILYYEYAYNRNAARNVLETVLRVGYQQGVRQAGDMPVNLPSYQYPNQTAYAAFVYDKGALFFDNLRSTVGDDTFYLILHEYFRTYQFGIARGEDFLRIAQSLGGDKVQNVYNEWVLGSKR